MSGAPTTSASSSAGSTASSSAAAAPVLLLSTTVAAGSVRVRPTWTSLVSSISLLRRVSSSVAALWRSVARSAEASAVLTAESAAVSTTELSTAEVATSSAETTASTAARHPRTSLAVFWEGGFAFASLAVYFVESLFCAFGKNAVPFEEHEAERFVFVRFLVDRSDDFFYFSKLLEISFNFIVRSGREHSADKHLSISSLRFFRINLFSIKFVVLLRDDSLDGFFVDEKDESEAT